MSETKNLKLYKHDEPLESNENAFDIDKALSKNWDKVDDDTVTALIELKVTPQGGDGFNKIAEQIYQYPQVETLYLMSGAYDFLVMVRGKSIKDISLFVSENLASIEEVQSTATYFTLTKYKEQGVNLTRKKQDGRMVITL